MSMLREQSGLAESLGYGISKQQCKPNYEEMIKNCNEKRAKCTAVLDSIVAFMDGSPIEGKLAELVGEIYGMNQTLKKRTDKLIKEQESWTDGQ